MTPSPAAFSLIETSLFFALALLAIYLPLAPISHAADRAVMPDLLYCLVVAWVLRRPASAPLPLVLGLGVFADVMLARPLGLGALGLVLASEALRAYRGHLLAAGFLTEWLASAAAFAALLASICLLLAVTFAEVPAVQQMTHYWIATALAYPVIALVLAWCTVALGGRR